LGHSHPVCNNPCVTLAGTLRGVRPTLGCAVRGRVSRLVATGTAKRNHTLQCPRSLALTASTVLSYSALFRASALWPRVTVAPQSHFTVSALSSAYRVNRTFVLRCIPCLRLAATGVTGGLSLSHTRPSYLDTSAAPLGVFPRPNSPLGAPTGLQSGAVFPPPGGHG
jgi:hypothetical protein